MKIQKRAPSPKELRAEYVKKALTNPKTLIRSRLKRRKHLTYSYHDAVAQKTLFIHIPKCAGISINKHLYNSLGAGHAPIDNYLLATTPSIYKKTFKFTVVRNPWDRLASSYFFLKNGGFDLKDKTFFDSELSKYNSFSEFVEEWVNKENIWKWNHFIPQNHFMTPKENRTDCDFICFFENLDDDLDAISNLTNHKIDSKSIPHSNVGPKKEYIKEYSEKAAQKVAEVYKDDIDLFGYNFSNSNIEKQIKERNRKFPIGN